MNFFLKHGYSILNWGSVIAVNVVAASTDYDAAAYVAWGCWEVALLLGYIIGGDTVIRMRRERAEARRAA